MISSNRFSSSSQVISRGLDERTAKAYRMDLEKFYFWLEEHEPEDVKAVEASQEDARRSEERDAAAQNQQPDSAIGSTKSAETGWEAQMENYLE